MVQPQRTNRPPPPAFAGIESLAPMPRLRELVLRDCPMIIRAQLPDLKKKLPNCVIDFAEYPDRDPMDEYDDDDEVYTEDNDDEEDEELFVGPLLSTTTCPTGFSIDRGTCPLLLLQDEDFYDDYFSDDTWDSDDEDGEAWH